MPKIQSFIDSEAIGSGPFTHRVNFTCEVSRKGFDELRLWDASGECEMDELPLEDRVKVLNLIAIQIDEVINDRRA